MMKCFIFSLVSVVVLLGTASCFTIKQNSTDEKVSIIGGEISQELVPYFVLLDDGKFYCGGTLISPQHVLTAAHCIQLFEPITNNEVRAFAGSSKLLEGEFVEIEYLKMHPEYSNRTYEHDIGVIKLKSPFTLSEKIQPIGLASYEPINNQMITITGFGRIDRNTDAISMELKQYTTGVFTYEECSKRINRNDVFPTDICDNGLVDEGICEGDSGGPVVSGNTVLGVVSRFNVYDDPSRPVNDCAQGLPDVFASVYHHMNFIKEWLSK